jgi:hypothetical protein
MVDNRGLAVAVLAGIAGAAGVLAGVVNGRSAMRQVSFLVLVVIGVVAFVALILIGLQILTQWIRFRGSPRPDVNAGPPGQQYKNKLRAGETLRVGESLFSPNQRYRLDVQEDGNVVLSTDKGGKLWSTKTAQTGKNNYLEMQQDGNLIVYTDKHELKWQSNTSVGGSFVVLQDDHGNLVIYPPGGGEGLWSSRGWFKRWLERNATRQEVDLDK